MATNGAVSKYALGVGIGGYGRHWSNCAGVLEHTRRTCVAAEGDGGNIAGIDIAAVYYGDYFSRADRTSYLYPTL